LGKVLQKVTGRGKGFRRNREWIGEYVQIVKEVQERMEVSAFASGTTIHN
jgi:uncharacterized membrane protein